MIEPQTTVPGAPLNTGMPSGLPTPPPSLGGQAPVPETTSDDLLSPGPPPPQGEISFPNSNVGAPPPLEPDMTVFADGAPPTGPAAAAKDADTGPSAAEVFSQDMADYIDPELLAQLKESAAGDKMDVTTAISFAGLAMTNPDLLREIMSHRESGRQNARNLLTQLQGQISTSRRTAMAAETSLNKAQLAADTAERKTRYTANATAVAQAAKQARAEGVEPGVPQPTGEALYDDEKTQGFLAAVDGAIGAEHKKIELVNKDFARLQQMVTKGVMDPKLVAPAMREVLKNAGYTPEEIEGKFSAQIMMAQSAAQSIRAAQEAQQARMRAATKGVEASLAQTTRKLDLYQRHLAQDQMQLTTEQQAEMRRMSESNENSIRLYTSYALAPDAEPATAKAWADKAAALTEQQGLLQDRMITMAQQSDALGQFQNVEYWERMILEKQDAAQDGVLGLPPGSTHNNRQNSISVEPPQTEYGAYGVKSKRQEAGLAVIYDKNMPPHIREALKKKYGLATPTGK